MDADDLVLRGLQIIVLGVIAFVIFIMPIVGIFDGTGQSQIRGYVMNVEQQSWPWPHTKVTFTMEHPTSITNAEYYTATFYGFHDFKLHKYYQITSYRPWYHFFGNIINVEVLSP